jgi:outer membrane protein
MTHLNRTTRLLSQALLAATLALTTAQAGAAEPLVGVVNVRRILSESRPGKEAMAKFQLDFGARGQEVMAQTDVLKQQTDALDKDLPTLAPAQALARQRDLAALGRELNRKKQQLNDEREARKREDIQHVIQLARGVVGRIARDAKMDLVFQDVVYASPRNDITERVLQALDAPEPR